MTEYNYKDAMFNFLLESMGMIANTTAMIADYSWEAKFSKKQCSTVFHTVEQKRRDEKIVIDVSKLDEAQLKMLGAWRWELDSDLMLLPLWLYLMLPNGIELISITGEKKTKGKDFIGTDIRAGCVAVGIIKKVRDEK